MSENAYKDENDVSTWIGVSCVDPTKIVRITLNSSNGGLSIDATTVISFTPDPAHATLRDVNGVPVKTAVSDADPDVILPLYVNPSTGAILIDT